MDFLPKETDFKHFLLLGAAPLSVPGLHAYGREESLGNVSKGKRVLPEGHNNATLKQFPAGLLV